MAKLVTIKSGKIIPIPGTAETWNGGIIITEKTRLIVDGDVVTIIYDDGDTVTEKNHRLELNANSHYEERPLLKKDRFIIKLGSILADIRYHIKRPYSSFTCFIRSAFQTLFRKSHISDYDLMDLDIYLAKRILPKITAYRKKYIEHEIFGWPSLLPGVDTSNISPEEAEKAKKAWMGVMDEIIFAMRYLLEKDTLAEAAFFKEHYGRFISYEEDREKHFEQTSLAEKRAQKGFELFGKFFTSFWW